MTHTPTLPNGFSRDFSEAKRQGDILVYVDRGTETSSVIAWWIGDDLFFSREGYIGNGRGDLRPLCWCPIPTPGEAVLKQLAEGK